MTMKNASAVTFNTVRIIMSGTTPNVNVNAMYLVPRALFLINKIVNVLPVIKAPLKNFAHNVLILNPK